MAGRRLTVVLAGFGLATMALAGRLIQLQFVDGESLALRADRQQISVEAIPARPGDIVDRHGRLLAVTIRESSLYAVPNQIDQPRAFAWRLATILEIDAARLEAALHRDRQKSFLWIARRLPDDRAEAVRQLDLPAETWGLRHEFRRHYPHGTLAAHLVGLRDIDNVGRGGIEERFDAELRGTDGRRTIRRDARGRVIDIPDGGATPACPGQTIVLSIDAVIQHYAEEALDELMAVHAPRSACAIVISIPQAEILALASRPTFDPNTPADAPDDAWINRAIAGVYEPGSTLKPLIVAWAIDAGVLEHDEEIDCENGAYRMGGRILHDHHGYGALSVADVLVKSSNIGMAKIGERLGRDRLHECLVAFGFGRTTGIELPDERGGVVRPLGDWNRYSIGSVPMGHEIAATPMQLITAYAALAGDGRLRQPTLVRHGVVVQSERTTKRNSVRPPAVTSPVLDDAVARWVVAGPMADTVRRGTGRAAAIDGYEVFGKTGTAQMFDVATGTFSHDLHVVSFVGGAPVVQPKVIVLVVADEPTGEGQSGGAVAAPAAAVILDRTLRRLGIPPASRPLGVPPIEHLVDESPQAYR